MTLPSPAWSGCDEDRRLSHYVRALERELELMEEIGRCAAAQCAAVAAHCPDDLIDATRTRAALAGTLDACEREVLPMRQAIGAGLASLGDHPVFERVRWLHGELRALIESVLKTDDETRQSIQHHDDELKTMAQALDAAAATLTAYRRVVAPPPRPAALVDRHG